VPETATVLGLDAAFEETESEELRAPTPVGVNVRLMVQLDPAVSELPQLVVGVVVWAKSLVLPPLNESEMLLSVAVPVLVSVMVCAPEVPPTAVGPKGTLATWLVEFGV
jgi:hypothetical protein